MFRSKLVSALALLCLSGATASYAADTTMPAGFPVIEPDTPKSATVTQPAHGALPPNVLLLPNSAAPVSAGQLIDDLGAVRFGRDGKQMDIDVPARLRNMLRAPRQEGVIPTGGSDCHGDRYDPIRLGTSVCRPESFAALRALTGR